MRVIFLTAVLVVFLWVNTAFAQGSDMCLKTESMSAMLIKEGFAFTSTFITSQGLVFQLYTGDKGFAMTWIKDMGDTSCLILNGDVWVWAGYQI